VVFDVKDSLVVPLTRVESKEKAEIYGVKLGCAVMTYDFVLVTSEAAVSLKRQKATEAMSQLGQKFVFLDDLPVPDVD